MSKGQKLKFGSERRRQTVDIPPGVSAENAMKVYNQGYGHSLANSIHFLTKHIGLMDIDSELKDAFVEYMREKLSKRNIHLKQPKGEKITNIPEITEEPLFNPEELRRIIIPPHEETKEELDERERARREIGELRETDLNKRLTI